MSLAAWRPLRDFCTDLFCKISFVTVAGQLFRPVLRFQHPRVSLRNPGQSRLIRPVTTSVASRRTLHDLAAVPLRRTYPAFLGPCGIARPVNLSLCRRESGQQSAPAGCALRRRCNFLLHSRWSAAPLPPFAEPSSVSSAWWCRHGCTRRAFVGRQPAPARWTFGSGVSGACEQVD